ncbi:MAG: hypothetical protein H7Z43_07510, partial [Clostridia bacterium]|nr:hypothetical protein [Deltaproteobacteria bacterium]
MRFLAVVVVATLNACGGDDAAVDLNLVTDLNLNTEAQLVAWVSSVEVQVDSTTGLYTAAQAGVGNDYSIENIDNDDALELVIRSRVIDGRLPNIRIERGGLPASGVDVRVLGLAKDGQHVASGGVSDIAFASGSRNLPVQ